jgi:ribosomal-protein-alanine N-acetyltransferase
MKGVKLSELTIQDSLRISELANDFELWSNLRDAMPHPYTIKDAKQFVNSDKENLNSLTFAIRYDNELCGLIGLKLDNDVYRHTAEVGFWIGKDFWGKGIATSALKQLIFLAFQKKSIKRLRAAVFEENYASMKVLVKCGFSKYGIGRKAVFKNDRFLDEHYFELLKED